MKNITLKFDTFLSLADDSEPEVEVEASYTPGSPAVMYLRNGDPGHPEEPDEVEILKVTRKDTKEELDWDSLSDANKTKLEDAARGSLPDDNDDDDRDAREDEQSNAGAEAEAREIYGDAQ